jgi:Xaa-Pro aminopeptidase
VGGKPNDIQKQFIDDVTQALYLTKEALKPGLNGKQIDSIPRNYLVKKGYADYMPMPFVHSTGLSEFEKPFFGPGSDDILQENQAICIDIPLFGHEKIPGIRVETGYRLNKNGAIPFSKFMEKLFGF